MTQLDMFAAPPIEIVDGLWTYERGMPDRSELAVFTHLIRGPYDDEETMGRGAGNRDPFHWKTPGSVESWREKITTLLEDEKPRTFNGICVALSGTTADVWFDAEPDHALWSLVADETLAWTNQRYMTKARKKTRTQEAVPALEMGCVLFTLSRFVAW